MKRITLLCCCLALLFCAISTQSAGVPTEAGVSKIKGIFWVELPEDCIFSGGNWKQLGASYDWKRPKGSLKKYKIGHYWHFENERNEMAGAMTTMFEGKAVVLWWYWHNQDQDKTIITYLKLRDGTWVKGTQGEYHTEKDYFLRNSILAVKISLKGEDGETYVRYFIAP